MERQIDIHVPTLTRVEGEGALHVRLDDEGLLDDVRLEIYEPPRFFEALMRGRHREEPIDVTARICGICPVAYQLSACAALEDLSGVQVSGQHERLRRLLYCGEWVESHVLHIGFLHAPDFLGCSSGVEIASREPEMVNRLLELKRVGNGIVELLGGRPIHPVNVRLGGFHRLPDPVNLSALRERLDAARGEAEVVARWVAGFDFPHATIDHELVSLRSPHQEYPIEQGRVVSDRGLDIDCADFLDHFEEYQVPHSTALPVRRIQGGNYLTGPLARWANNFDLLPADMRDLATELGVGSVERNPFRSIVIRALEVRYAFDEAVRLIDGYDPPDQPAVEVPATAGVGHGVTEAPRGVLYHRYEVGADELITDARIVPPTAQNQAVIEADVRSLAEQYASEHHDSVAFEAGLDELRHRCEVMIRNYDPCISCATHFLKVELEQ